MPDPTGKRDVDGAVAKSKSFLQQQAKVLDDIGKAFHYGVAPAPLAASSRSKSPCFVCGMDVCSMRAWC